MTVSWIASSGVSRKLETGWQKLFQHKIPRYIIFQQDGSNFSPNHLPPSLSTHLTASDPPLRLWSLSNLSVSIITRPMVRHFFWNIRIIPSLENLLNAMTSPEAFSKAKKFFWSLLLLGLFTILLIGYFEEENFRENIKYHGTKQVIRPDGMNQGIYRNTSGGTSGWFSMLWK